MLTDDPAACYQALRTQDRRFDGVFFVGVTTTGIYCRPVCPARTPLPENCRFFDHAARAEQAGFRPCLRCRPELAPGNAPMDAIQRLAQRAARRIEEGALSPGSLQMLAAELSVSERHLRRVVEEAFGVTPHALAQTQRLLLAKQLLTDTTLPVTEVAFASGFASLRRFNQVFQERYQLSPSALRRTSEPPSAIENVTVTLGYRPPLAWDALLRFLDARALRGVESSDGGTYRRTLLSPHGPGWLSVTPVPDKPLLRVELSLSLSRALPWVLTRVKRLFDLTAQPTVIAEQLGPLASACPGLRVLGAVSGFEAAVRAILGQQVSVRAATTLAGRWVAAFGAPLETPFPELTHLAPTAETVAGLPRQSLIDLGLTDTRAGAILALAQAVAGRRLVLEPGAPIEPTLAALRALPGVGEWTAQYVALRALSWPDAFPHTDLGVMKALGETRPAAVLARAEAWRPWRGYAVVHLWHSLENPT